ncbi:N-methylhydantoinase A [Rhodovastum atsumiense]|uniref:Hydantoinase/oxoprolinase family protein n=1 Tax=Rhodovastum atsumiense TaxID=504468 RepID=A0A5M6IXR3_9PROT|nr:hydantoinase/oxoprolinase family protein [Rhodovastum atsumiense]KAA5612749.1 hydantoinase/oxoprolinase family protein [Rhodovastum atsumiense]CAH2602689.1 N-methylhydantoinase A [Rhodovastum atsumiense]
MTPPAPARLAVDIGGTFTDMVLEHGARRTTAKVLTRPEAPARGVLEGVRRVLAEAGVAPAAVGLIVHGTTLATNAIVERRGARTALLTTEGHRDSIEIAFENRFAQYDVFIEKPAPLVARPLRLGVPERMDAQGRVRLPLDETALADIAATLRREAVESVAIGFLHSYANPAHEQRAAALLAEWLPGVRLTLSAEVCPEMREYERFSTAVANAYVQPLMARYLEELTGLLHAEGLSCPLLLMTSGGGLTTLETAIRYPVRLVESGPAGGAILAAQVARELGRDRILSFDMGGTTAKICLIDDGTPLASRRFEVDRRYRFLQGSGLPLRIPAIEMVEIGAGGGSIAAVDALARVAVGPESAGADPGPACYDRGGERPTVTDANLLLGRIDPEGFAGGSIALTPGRAEAAVRTAVAAPLGLEASLAAFAITEMVEENMANAARVHAVERGTELAGRTLVAFGGSAPLHAARLAEKLGIDEVVIPAGAGVGSAVGFLRAPIAFEVARSRQVVLDALDAEEVNALLAVMAAEAEAVVRLGAPGGPIRLRRAADMRYVGQGHEITVPLPEAPLDAGAPAELRRRFEAAYTALFARTIPGLAVEVMGWSLTAESPAPPAPPASTAMAATTAPAAAGRRRLFDPTTAAFIEVPVYWRATLPPGAAIAGPAVIAEAETTTVVTAAFTAALDAAGAIWLRAAHGTAKESH